MAFERAYRFTCSFCKYRLDVVPTLSEWAKTVMERHANQRHSLELEKLQAEAEKLNADASKKTEKEEEKVNA